ncbi:hypothetical protein [Flavobacterium sp.]|uniref:hypothetical protein n=1 Tax=Flavobacterium sp. TaxID=239 RepID=UPI003750C506
MPFKINLLLILFLSFFSEYLFAQDSINKDNYTDHNKGKFYIYWGGNRENFSKSDIHFYGSDYDFTLYDVIANDKPKGWHADYINPARMTIPQTNFRLGYFITDHYNISIGLDHMKYVMDQYRTVAINGYYPNEGTYGESLPNNQVLLTENFLTFEHTDGLNYVNTEFSRVDDISRIFKISNTDKFQINFTEGIGIGILIPKTNAKLLENSRHDDFHLSGYGVSGKLGINFTFYKHFFIQTELKGGYINMNDIRTTINSNDRAEQEILFLQKIITLGGIFKI